MYSQDISEHHKIPTRSTGGISLMRIVNTEGGDWYFKCEVSTKLQETWKNQGNMIPPEDHNYFTVNKLKDKKISDLPDKELIQNSCFKETQWSTWKHRKTIQENQENNTQIEKFKRQKL